MNTYDTTTLTNEDRAIFTRGDCAGDINIPDRMSLSDRADYRAMITRELAKAGLREEGARRGYDSSVIGDAYLYMRDSRVAHEAVRP